MPTKGRQSVINLHNLLVETYGSSAIRLIGDINEDVDAFGWVMLENPRYLFSVSTWAGEMDLNMYDLQVSISDETLDNGDFILNDDVMLEKIPGVIESVIK